MCFKDYYKILEIGFPSNGDEIKTAYRRISLKWHPDKNPGIDTSNLMIDINEEYYILNNPDKKNRYDCEYIKYINFLGANNQKAENKDYTNPESYNPYDLNVRQDIKDAHDKATELVNEFLNSLKKASKDAAKGAWDNMFPYIIVGIIFSLIALIVKSCE